jgi:hypothetical protein
MDSLPLSSKIAVVGESVKEQSPEEEVLGPEQVSPLLDEVTADDERSVASDAEELIDDDELPTIVADRGALEAALASLEVEATDESPAPLGEQVATQPELAGAAAKPAVDVSAEDDVREQEENVSVGPLVPKVRQGPVASLVPVGGVHIEIGGAAPSGTLNARPMRFELAGVSQVRSAVPLSSEVSGSLIDPPEADEGADTRVEWQEDIDPESSMGMGPYQNAPGAEDTIVGDVSVEQRLILAESGPISATVNLDEAGEAADVIAEGGAIRVALSLGTNAPPGRDSVTKGVAVSAAEPVAASPGRSGAARGAGATDLVKLARLKEEFGGPGVRVDAMATEEELPGVVVLSDSDDWLGADEGGAAPLSGGMGPFGEDEETGP